MVFPIHYNFVHSLCIGHILFNPQAHNPHPRCCFDAKFLHLIHGIIVGYCGYVYGLKCDRTAESV